MNRPFPLPQDVGIKRTRAATYLYRAAAAHLRGYVSRGTPLRAAEQLFGRDVVTAEILKAASTPAETTTPGWAQEIARVAIYDAVQSITSLSAAAEVIARGLRITMDHIAEHRVPGRVINAAAAAGMWVAEAGPAPARALAVTNAAILRPRRLSVLYTYSREQALSSNIENIVRQTLSEASGLALDAQMFSALAGDASKPAGLLAGVAPLAPTSGGGVAARDGDLKNLFTALAAQGAGKTAVIVAAMPQAVTLKASVGPNFDFDIIASTALAAGTAVALEVASFCSGFSPVPKFRVSNLATYHAEDTAPTNITGGTPSPAVPVRSMFQTDSIGLYMDLWASWGLRAAGHAQWVQGATW